MSPEQLRGESLDVRSDIYSFGAFWYRVFTGRVPFAGASLAAIQLAREGVEAPSMGYALRHYQPVVDNTLAGNRSDRYSSAQELIDSIQNYAGCATGMYRQLTIPAQAEQNSI